MGSDQNPSGSRQSALISAGCALGAGTCAALPLFELASPAIALPLSILLSVFSMLSAWRAVQLQPPTANLKNSKPEKDRRAFAEVTLQAISDAVIATDLHGDILYLNDSASVMTAWSSTQAQGRPLGDVFRIMCGSDRGMILDPAAETLKTGNRVLYEGNTVLLTNEGKPLAIDASISAIRDEEGDVIGAVIAFRDVEKERKLSNKLAWQARHDALTGLYNRNEFEYRLNLMYQSAKHRGREHTLLYVDLDQFKVVNDTCGHLAGDALLKQLTSLLRNEVRSNDTLARLGGDEFGVLLENCAGDDASRIANALLYTIQSFRFRWKDKTFNVGASIGLVRINQSSEGVTQLLAAADSACYAAKDAGRNRIQAYTDEDAQISRRDGELQWISHLTRALEEDKLQLYCQQITPINVEDHGLYYEVLLRLIDEDDQPISSGLFLPAAERYNMSARIDRWVLNHTLSWLQNHPDHLEQLHLCSINVSGQSVGDHQFLEFVSEQLGRYQVPPEKICFEITETAVIANMAQAVDFITTLRVLGCRFALDDFGSGLSSFGYLKNLPVDILKIDGVFIRDMLHDPINQALVKSINDIGHVMDKMVVAEFVGDDDILEAIRHCGIDYAQGYAIHQPMPIDAVLETTRQALEAS